MSSFIKVYNNIRKELLSEQENVEQNQIQTQPIEGLDDTQDDTASQDQENATVSTKLDPDEEISALKEDEKGLIDKNWIDKIIKLLNFLDKEDDNVKDIISKLSEDVDNIKGQKTKIEELLNSIPPEKTS
jgi:hypothetical protein